jgi:hypothetical protein
VVPVRARGPLVNHHRLGPSHTGKPAVRARLPSAVRGAQVASSTCEGAGAEIGELVGVCKQRVYQIADEGGFPTPVAKDARGRLWNRRVVAAWVE